MLAGHLLDIDHLAIETTLQTQVAQRVSVDLLDRAAEEVGEGSIGSAKPAVPILHKARDRIVLEEGAEFLRALGVATSRLFKLGRDHLKLVGPPVGATPRPDGAHQSQSKKHDERSKPDLPNGPNSHQLEVAGRSGSEPIFAVERRRAVSLAYHPDDRRLTRTGQPREKPLVVEEACGHPHCDAAGAIPKRHALLAQIEIAERALHTHQAVHPGFAHNVLGCRRAKRPRIGATP